MISEAGGQRDAFAVETTTPLSLDYPEATGEGGCGSRLTRGGGSGSVVAGVTVAPMLRNFSYVIEDALAGCALPGSWGPLIEDLREAQEAGITAIVTLTERGLIPALVQEAGMRYLHIPIADFTAPTLGQVEQFVRFVDEVREEDGAVLVHCFAGIGRTGTMLAAYLVTEGRSAKEAILEVRRKRPGSIETSEQEEIVFEYEAKLRRKG